MCSQETKAAPNEVAPAVSAQLCKDSILSRNSTEIELNNMDSATAATLRSAEGVAACHKSHTSDMVRA